ncbi:MAG: hypothetical protein BHV99_02985 [Clostridium sp. 26_21]|mgnify:CR=1 FL=1|nr:MAG: hypothetical protein BHV99_02985 [Clostridium sp. 26_21]
MRKVGFVGVYDKIDLILSIAKVLVKAGKRVLVIDSTTLQKAKYIVPNILPTINYITSYDDIDVAVGFENIAKIKQYVGLEDDEELEYDFILIDIDNLDGATNFEIGYLDKNYFVTSFDGYSLKKGIELLRMLNMPLRMERIFYSKEMLKEEEEYFNYLTLDLKIEWDENKLYFLLDNGDLSAQMENHLVQNIKFKNLSNEYKENVVFLVNELSPDIGERTIRKIIKEM